MKQNDSVTYRPDLLKVITDATTPRNLASINAQKPCVSNVVYSKDQVNANRKAHARWVAHTSGNAYVLYVQARSYDQKPMRIQAYGKNVHQAVRRYYRGYDGSCNHIWKCTKVVAVYTCADKSTAQAGDLLHGVAQDSAPW